MRSRKCDHSEKRRLSFFRAVIANEVERRSRRIGKYSILYVSLFMGLLACDRRPSYQRQAYETSHLRSSVVDVRVPVSLWKKIEESHISVGPVTPAAAKENETHGGAPGEQGEGDPSVSAVATRAAHRSAHTEIPTDFMSVKVYLTEKNSGVLGGKNRELIFSEGGGEIDLKDFLTDRDGTFHIAFQVPSEEGARALKVFYLSNARKKKAGHNTYGAGCNTFFDISSYAAAVMKKEGVRVNTMNGRHISVLAGTYFFVVPYDNLMRIARVTVKDSRYRSAHCQL